MTKKKSRQVNHHNISPLPDTELPAYEEPILDFKAKEPLKDYIPTEVQYEDPTTPKFNVSLFGDFQDGLRLFVSIIRGSLPEPQKRDQLRRLCELAKYNHSLSANQVDAICARTSNYINDLYIDKLIPSHAKTEPSVNNKTKSHGH